MKHVKQVVDENQGNEGDDEHESYKEVDEGARVDDKFYYKNYVDLVGDSEFDRYKKPSSPIDPSSHIDPSTYIVPSTPHNQPNLNPYEQKTSN